MGACRPGDRGAGDPAVGDAVDSISMAMGVGMAGETSERGWARCKW